MNSDMNNSYSCWSVNGAQALSSGFKLECEMSHPHLPTKLHLKNTHTQIARWWAIHNVSHNFKWKGLIFLTDEGELCRPVQLAYLGQVFNCQNVFRD